jgi:hypothetical protein
LEEGYIITMKIMNTQESSLSPNGGVRYLVPTTPEQVQKLARAGVEGPILVFGPATYDLSYKWVYSCTIDGKEFLHSRIVTMVAALMGPETGPNSILPTLDRGAVDTILEESRKRRST